MADTKLESIPPEVQQAQVAAYLLQLPDYRCFAESLRGVLKQACQSALPTAEVEARAKSVESFAEKCARKWGKYQDPVNEFSDLCGGRVIVQTLDQVRAVRQFIEANFTILETDEKGVSLGEDKFGYRDTHFVVRLDAAKAAQIGFTPDAIARIGDKKAEIQVRTWVQHAWADVIHDRMYKTRLRYPGEFRRTGALLAAIMEDGDRQFNRLAESIDGMLVNFNAYADRSEVEQETVIQERLLEVADEKNKPAIALQLARLQAAGGNYVKVVDRLAEFATCVGPLQDEILVELGYALCKANRADSGGQAFKQGQQHLRRVVQNCRDHDPRVVPNLRKRVNLQARAQARLGWSFSVQPGQRHQARGCYRAALELEPGNPYFLADVVGYEISCLRTNAFVGAMASSLRGAIRTCREHIINGTEMPFACFTSGRLHLLLGENEAALGDYARGIRHMLSFEQVVPPDTLDAEKDWLVRVTEPDPLTLGYLWAGQLVDLARRILDRAVAQPAAVVPSDQPDGLRLAGPVIIVAGGAGSFKPESTAILQPILEEALAGFQGTVISGGTTLGVPGCVAEAAKALERRGSKPFTLVGYLPKSRPDDARKDDRYDRHVLCGESGFTAEQLLCNWLDILDAGLDPADVRLIGWGGGPLAAAEYRIALALGATVGILTPSGDEADALLKDEVWQGTPTLLPLPADTATARAFVVRPSRTYGDATINEMARAFHANYLAGATSRLPGPLRPWPTDVTTPGKHDLGETFRRANMHQARYAVEILTACGFDVYEVEPPAKPVLFAAADFSDAEVEKMAALEHGRWTVERLRDGWRLGPRDDGRKRHPNLVTWSDLPDGPDGVKKYDRAAARAFPEILAKAGLEVRR